MARAKQYLDKAKFNAYDEFYTQMTYIENEMWFYRKHFKNKIIYCNCDDPTESKFFQHFKKKFKTYGLKKLITTCYKSNNPDFWSTHKSERSFARFYDGERERETSSQ